MKAVSHEARTARHTAFTKGNRSDYSACTTWGIFVHPQTGKQAIILLDAFRDKMEFPELKTRAKDHYRRWNPDMVLIEGRASGQPLIFELRAMGIPVEEHRSSAGQDKIVRVNSVSDMFASHMIYAPDTKWAEEVIEECAEFPNGMHDDYVDTVSQAILRMRRGGFVNHQKDYQDEERPVTRVSQSGYY